MQFFSQFLGLTQGSKEDVDAAHTCFGFILFCLFEYYKLILKLNFTFFFISFILCNILSYIFAVVISLSYLSLFVSLQALRAKNFVPKFSA